MHSATGKLKVLPLFFLSCFDFLFCKFVCVSVCVGVCRRVLRLIISNETDCFESPYELPIVLRTDAID